MGLPTCPGRPRRRGIRRKLGLSHYTILATVSGETLVGALEQINCKLRGLLRYGEAPVVALLREALLRDANLDTTVLCPTSSGRVRLNRLGVCIAVRHRSAKAT